jgi:hypothetical protein
MVLVDDQNVGLNIRIEDSLGRDKSFDLLCDLTIVAAELIQTPVRKHCIVGEEQYGRVEVEPAGVEAMEYVVGPVKYRDDVLHCGVLSLGDLAACEQLAGVADGRERHGGSRERCSVSGGAFHEKQAFSQAVHLGIGFGVVEKEESVAGGRTS